MRAVDAPLCQQPIPRRGVLQGDPSHPSHLQGGLGGVGKSRDLPVAGSLSIQTVTPRCWWHRDRRAPCLGAAAFGIRLCHRASTPPSPCPSKPGFQPGHPKHPRRGPFFLPAPAGGLTGWPGCSAACGLGKATGMPQATTSGAEKFCQSGRSSESHRESPAGGGPMPGSPPPHSLPKRAFNQPAVGGRGKRRLQRLLRAQRGRLPAAGMAARLQLHGTEGGASNPFLLPRLLASPGGSLPAVVCQPAVCLVLCFGLFCFVFLVA